jgi:hypothetical protein
MFITVLDFLAVTLACALNVSAARGSPSLRKQNRLAHEIDRDARGLY